jgi:hypothetical protein
MHVLFFYKNEYQNARSNHQNWSVMLGKEHRLRVFKNRVLRKMVEVTEECRKWHNEELHDLC